MFPPIGSRNSPPPSPSTRQPPFGLFPLDDFSAPSTVATAKDLFFRTLALYNQGMDVLARSEITLACKEFPHDPEIRSLRNALFPAARET